MSERRCCVAVPASPALYGGDPDETTKLKQESSKRWLDQQTSSNHTSSDDPDEA